MVAARGRAGFIVAISLLIAVFGREPFPPSATEESHQTIVSNVTIIRIVRLTVATQLASPTGVQAGHSRVVQHAPQPADRAPRGGPEASGEEFRCLLASAILVGTTVTDLNTSKPRWKIPTTKLKVAPAFVWWLFKKDFRRSASF